MACNCNEEGKIINIGMGCCVPVVANADAYYTKSEIDEKIDEIVISGGGITSGEVQTMIDESIADKADKSEIPTVPTNVSAFVNDVPYLTQHQSLSGYATEQWVLDKHYISGVDLSDYATKEYVSGYTYDKATIDEKVAGGGTFDPTQYYNKTQTNELLGNKLDVSAYTPCDLSNYYNKTEVDNIVNSAKTEVENEIPSLSGYATQQWVEDKHYITGVDLSDYATEQWVQNQGYLTEHQSLSAYSTTQEVTNMINQSVSGKQDTLSAGTGISITNNVISVTGGSITVDQTLNSGSTNAIANSAVTNAINAISAKTPTDGYVSAVTASRSSTTVTVDTYKLGGHVTNNIEFPKINGTGIVGNSNNYQLATQADLSAHTADSTVHVTSTEKNTWNSKVDSSTLNNYLLKSKIWCGTQAQYDAITTKDSETLYLIHS